MKKKINGFTIEDFYLKETWVFLRLTEPKTCLNCRAFLKQDCEVLSDVQGYIHKYFNRTLQCKEIFLIGSQCSNWR